MKDRPALRMLLDAQADGRLTRDRILIDSTSGNTGVAYAWLGAALGYRVALDTNWPPQDWSAALRAEVATWVTACDHVLLNDLEVRSLADVQELDEALGRVRGMLKPGAALVVKSGARGAIGVVDGERSECAARRATIFDTTGAGDSFNAGYLIARLNGAGLGAAVSAGCETAAAIITRFPRRVMSRAVAPTLEQA